MPPCLATALAEMILGVPLLSYFDDFGPMGPADIGEEALSLCGIFAASVGFFLNKNKKSGRR